MTVADQKGAGDDAEAHRRRIAVNFFTLAGTSVVGLLVTIAISIFLRRALGPVAIGQLSWAVAATAYFNVFVNPGLTTVGQRELSKDPSRGQELLALILTLQTGLAVVVYGLVLGLAAMGIRGPVVSQLLLIQGLTLFLIAWNTGWVLLSSERMVAPSIASLVFNFLQLPALLLLIHSPGDVYLYAALGLPILFLGVVYNLWYVGRHGLARPLRLRPTLGGASALLRESWPLALSIGAVTINGNTATIILGFTDGDDVVGQYATAFRLMMVACIITASFWNAYFPALARSQASPERATALSREYLALLAWVGLPTAALGWASGRHVVALMYGDAFAPSGPYFEWLCLNIAISFLNYGIVFILVPWDRSVLQFKILVVGTSINLLINLIAIPLYGVWGAIAATVVSESAILLVGLVARRRLAIFWHPVSPIVLPPLICSAGVAGLIIVLPSTLDRYWLLELATGAVLLGACFAVFQRNIFQRFCTSAFARLST